jgi:asparagine synthase (glutamine-hydrolysing)
MLDRKDRLSMAVGLEVRVPFCDHRLVEYLWNVPWEFKTTGGIEKGLLRNAVDGLLPDDITWRPKSAYPTTKDPSYAKAIDAATAELLADPAAPLFDLVDRKALRDAVDGGHTSAATSAPFGTVGPYQKIGLSYLLDIDNWLRQHRVRLV